MMAPRGMNVARGDVHMEEGDVSIGVCIELAFRTGSEVRKQYDRNNIPSMNHIRD
jgi:hypothetical protein